MATFAVQLKENLGHFVLIRMTELELKTRGSVSSQYQIGETSGFSMSRSKIENCI
jgi:hypothetical protein